MKSRLSSAFPRVWPAGCALIGILAAAGFGHDHGWLLPLGGLTVLFFIAAAASPRRAAWTGYSFGLGYFAFGVSWTYASLANYGQLAPFLAALITGLLIAGLAGYYAAALYLGRYLGQTLGPVGARLMLAAAWTLAEFLRGILFTGFNWLAAGYAQVPAGPLAGWIPLIGVTGTTGLVVALAALLSVWRRAELSARTKTGWVLQWSAVVVLLGGGLALRTQDWTTPLGNPLSVSVLQGAVPQHSQWLASNARSIPGRYYDLAQRSRGRLVIAPETSIPTNWERAAAKIGPPFEDLAAARQGAVILGTFLAALSGDGRNTNSAVVLSGTRETLSYHKRKLTPYGEFLPLAMVLEPLLKRARIPYANLVPGAGDGSLELPFVKLGMGICYEDAFAHLYRANNAQVLVNLTNDSWFDDTAMPSQHLQISKARALENGRWLIRASNTGPSALIRPDGTAAILPAGRSGVLEGQVELRTGTTPYHRFGDWPALILALAILVAGVAKRYRRGEFQD